MIPAENFEIPKLPLGETPAVQDEQVSNIQNESGTQAKSQALPEDVAETGGLADLIAQAVSKETNYSVRNLRVEVTPASVKLTGTCRTYYTKQKAQHAVLENREIMNSCGTRQLINAIEVQ